MKFDDVFLQIGAFGKYQTALLILLMFTIGWPSTSISNIFTLVDIRYTCRQSNFAGLLNDSNNNIMYNGQNGPNVSMKTVDQCYKYSAENQTVECTQWEFDHSEYGRTHIEKFQLICDRSWLRSFSNTMFVLGVGIGSQTFGYLSDRFGRLRVFIGAELLSLVSWAIAIAAPQYPVYAVARFLTGSAFIGWLFVGFVYLMEMVGPSKRLVVGTLYNLGFSVGYMLLSGMAFAVKDSFYVELLCIVPIAVFLLFFFFASESPRWLLVNGQREKASQILNKMQSINNKSTAPPIDVTDITVEILEEQGTLIDVFKSKALRKRCLILMSYWVAVTLLYYALVFNSAALIPGNFFLNQFFLAAVGIPGTILGLLLSGWKRTGRRVTCSLVMIIPGIVGFLNVPCTLYGLDLVVMILTMIGKLCIDAAFSVIYLYTAELFPTEVRTSAFGTCSTFGRIGSILATFVGRELASVWLPLPYVVFGVFGTITGSLCLMLPETLNKKLSETIKEVDEEASMSVEDIMKPVAL